MNIPSLSPKLNSALINTLENLETPPQEAEIALLIAMKQILTRIELGEQNLYEPLHRGDLLALTLAKME
jgi:hypothetical protein